MEGTTEPIIAVIGHPIAGNPSQFAVERALHAMKLDWRVLSFDVQPTDVAAALEGFSVTGIVGVLIDPSIASAAAQWAAERSRRDSGSIDDGLVEEQATALGTEKPEADADAVPVELEVDCLFRDETKRLVASHQAQVWVDEQIAAHRGEHRIWFGKDLSGVPVTPAVLEDRPTVAPPSSEQVRAADVIVITEGPEGPVELEIEDWPRDDGTTLLINFSRDRSMEADLRALGYALITPDDVRVGTLQRCLLRWTGQAPPTDVLRDAIEEYLGV